MRKTMAVPALALLLAAAGCGSGDTGKRDDGTAATCRSLLGAAGLDVTMFGGSELCRIVVRDQKPRTSVLSLCTARRCGGEGVRLREPSCGAERALIPGL
ncbi:hypothetical protein [Streptomyces murinus]|uniref:hypothetical protein n=1 Tax=Streptomyces murinus TaxID=33900 RepID=UPI0021155DAF|nr:hypothetical protein [Streptomyces murinus]